jgi:hypothetical protein
LDSGEYCNVKKIEWKDREKEVRVICV